MPALINRVKNKLERVQNRVLQKFSSHGLILMYHRIAEEDIDPWSLRVTPKNFADHLEVLGKYTNPLTLQELNRDRQQDRIRDCSVAITFDDGYANNLYQAKPLLEKYQIPATVFVATDYLTESQEFWWDELERIILQTEKLPETLTLNIEGDRVCWSLGKASYYSHQLAWQNRNLPAWEATPGSRLHFYFQVWAALQPLTPTQRNPLLEEIKAWADYPSPVPRLSHRPLTVEELPAIEESGIVQLGGHTQSHPLLPEHPLEVQRQEIQQSKDYLEKILKHPITTFAYPFGAYNHDTLSSIAAAGFDCACSTIETTVWQKSDRFLLPRFEVRNWDKSEFERRLLQWLSL